MVSNFMSYETFYNVKLLVLDSKNHLNMSKNRLKLLKIDSLESFIVCQQKFPDSLPCSTGPTNFYNLIDNGRSLDNFQPKDKHCTETMKTNSI